MAIKLVPYLQRLKLGDLLILALLTILVGSMIYLGFTNLYEFLICLFPAVVIGLGLLHLWIDRSAIFSVCAGLLFALFITTIAPLDDDRFRDGLQYPCFEEHVVKLFQKYPELERITYYDYFMLRLSVCGTRDKISQREMVLSNKP